MTMFLIDKASIAAAPGKAMNRFALRDLILLPLLIVGLVGLKSLPVDMVIRWFYLIVPAGIMTTGLTVITTALVCRMPAHAGSRVGASIAVHMFALFAEIAFAVEVALLLFTPLTLPDRVGVIVAGLVGVIWFRWPAVTTKRIDDAVTAAYRHEKENRNNRRTFFTSEDAKGE